MKSKQKIYSIASIVIMVDLILKFIVSSKLVENDIIKVISKYMVIDAEGLDIQITSTESDTNNGSVPALFANIPIKDMRNSDK